MKQGIDYYIENGYKVFTKTYHLKRGTCCQSGCRHCPWDYKFRTMKNKDDVFFDMDGVLADFHGKINRLIKEHYADESITEKIVPVEKLTDNIYIEGHPEREPFIEAFEPLPGFYRDLEPIKEVVEAFKELSKHYNMFILSTASWGNPSCWTDKRLWVEEHLGEFAYKNLILTHHKNQHSGRALVDDRTKNGAANFKGEHMHLYTEKYPTIQTVLNALLP